MLISAVKTASIRLSTIKTSVRSPLCSIQTAYLQAASKLTRVWLIINHVIHHYRNPPNKGLLVEGSCGSWIRCTPVSGLVIACYSEFASYSIQAIREERSHSKLQLAPWQHTSVLIPCQPSRWKTISRKHRMVSQSSCPGLQLAMGGEKEDEVTGQCRSCHSPEQHQ